MTKERMTSSAAPLVQVAAACLLIGASYQSEESNSPEHAETAEFAIATDVPENAATVEDPLVRPVSEPEAPVPEDSDKEERQAESESAAVQGTVPTGVLLSVVGDHWVRSRSEDEYVARGRSTSTIEAMVDARRELGATDVPEDVSEVLKANRATSAILVDVDRDALRRGGWLQLGAGVPLEFVQVKRVEAGGIEGEFRLYETSNHEPAVFHETHFGVVGSISLANETYQVRTTSSGRSVLLKIDQHSYPADHSGAHLAGRSGTWISEVDWAGGCSDAIEGQQKTPIHALLVYTEAAERQHSIGIESDLVAAAMLTNFSFERSGVGIELSFGVRRTAWKESGTDEENLEALVLGSGAAAEIHHSRDATKADVVLVATVMEEGCGLAAGIAPPADRAYAIFDAACGVGVYTLAHELGHLLGARHDPAEDPENSPVSFQHGFLTISDEMSFMTMMAVRKPGSRPRRQLIWSNPRRRFINLLAGTSTESDNACLLNKTATVVAGFR